MDRGNGSSRSVSTERETALYFAPSLFVVVLVVVDDDVVVVAGSSNPFVFAIT